MSGLKRPYGDGNLQAMGSPLNNRNVVIKESDILVQKIDEVSAAVTYVGKAQCGANVAGAIWQIMRISVAGTVTTIDWADGDGKFNNVWNDRTTLSYS